MSEFSATRRRSQTDGGGSAAPAAGTDADVRQSVSRIEVAVVAIGAAEPPEATISSDAGLSGGETSDDGVAVPINGRGLKSEAGGDYQSCNHHGAQQDETSGSDDDVEKPTCECWTAIVCFCLVELMSGGILGSFSVLYSAPFQSVGVSASIRSWMYNVGKSLMFVAGFLAGPLSTVFGFRIAPIGLFLGVSGLLLSALCQKTACFFLAYAILMGGGIGFSHYVLYIHMQKHADGRRGLATGIYRAAKAASAASIPQLSRYLTSVAGFALMMLTVASLTFVAMVFAVFQTAASRCARRRKKGDGPLAQDLEETGGDTKQAKPTRKEKVTLSTLGSRLRNSLDVAVLKDPVFLVIAVMDCLQAFAMASVFFALPFYAVERGFGAAAAASFLTVIEVTDVVGALIIPPLYDLKCLNFLYPYGSMMFLASGCLFGIAGPKMSMKGMFVMAAFLGVMRAGTSGMANIILIKFLSIERFPSALSIKVVFKFWIFIFGSFNGYLVDLSQTYATCLHVAAVGDLLAGFLTVVLLFLAKAHRHDRQLADGGSSPSNDH